MEIGRPICIHHTLLSPTFLRSAEAQLSPYNNYSESRASALLFCLCVPTFGVNTTSEEPDTHQAEADEDEGRRFRHHIAGEFEGQVA